MPRGQQVALLNAVENDVLGPCFVLEAPVGRPRRRHRFEFFVEQGLGHALLPELGHAVPVIDLLLDDLGRVLPRLDRHFLERPAYDGRVHNPESIVDLITPEVLIDQVMTFLGNLTNRGGHPFHCLKVFIWRLEIAPAFRWSSHSRVPPF